jgi:hypothetical protein
MHYLKKVSNGYPDRAAKKGNHSSLCALVISYYEAAEQKDERALRFHPLVFLMFLLS